ncbi:5'-3' exoribonuclease 1 isoform X2 [Galleria mellonella]|uniref:5'-3' exoribonuclease 1 n=1 Tax=Galleria mellonella TaxID=7137 RepID=A0A6J1WDT0_GALME|nr:5'-3' exoribonuclease 1 isoform X2 [Galleria mellonella]
MGVPKFFRYTSERYPCLNELVKQYQIPDFDNMYLDMNGIIHNCSHPDDSNPHFRITEEKIFKDIFHYLGTLFQIIKPKKLFFMAIDGVAPRAKMNQQRGRRFRSAREAEKLEEEAIAKGEVLPTEKRFDSNCITPGTAFMVRLHEQLKYFVKHKMSTDPLWSKVKVILSGHETPGEGEHKIMDYIRWARSQPDYDPNTRHCLYGLDADLIMLGMCTHEPHFALLREEVKFGKTTQRATSPEETNFYLLHLSLLREYLEQEFISIKNNLPFEYDIEKIVDDWVLMGFLVGNDFIPHLPHMHISNDALPLLYKTYMTVLPTLDGYINEAGDLNLGRFEIFMQELAKIDKEKFQDVYTDLKYFEGKTGRRPNAMERREYKPNNDETFNVNIEDIKSNKPDDELQALINATEDMFIDEEECEEDEYEETSDEEANMETEFRLHKRDYYMNKLDYSKVTDEVLADQAEGYVRAIQWNLFYYYKGCPSWCWYYPHHYAPYISDIKGFKDLKIEFELGEPFKPFEQLLAVLPAASKHLLPTPFHDLMTDEDSPIVHYYPLNFETDLNGKRNDWEAVVLIPFIDETNLLSAMAPCYQRLTDEELKRNSHGPMLVYNWTPESLGVAEAPKYFPRVTNNHASERCVWRHELAVPEDQLRRGMLPNARRDLLFPGFPTMRHLKYKASLKKCKVKVFDQPSRNENMMIELTPEKPLEESLEVVAKEYLGKVIWVGWPHLTRAKVIAVSNESKRLHYVDKRNNNVGAPNYTTEPNTGNLRTQWISERSTIIEHNLNRLGIELGEVKIIIHAVNLRGFKYLIQDNSQIAIEPEWCQVPCGYALQAVVRAAVDLHGAPTRYRTPQEAYPSGDTVFLLTPGQYYGCLATVIDSESIRSGRIKVQVQERAEPAPALPAAAAPYRAAHHAAAACGISTQMLSRITGTVLVVTGERNDLPTETMNKINIGLNLKFNKKNQEVTGFTRRCKVTNAWLYSDRCIELVKSYAQNFPELFNRLAMTLGRDIFFEGDLWPGEIGNKKPQEVAAWIKQQPHASAARRECGSESLEPTEMKALHEELQTQLSRLSAAEKRVTLHVKWSLLYKPELHEGNIQPDPSADFQLLDRVVCVSPRMAVKRGATGTVVGVHPAAHTNTVRLSDRLNAEPSYLVMFDEPFPGGMTEELFDEPRFYRMQSTALLNISYGRKLRVAKSANMKRDEVSLNHTPNLLRKEDGHHSAFASYSPPGDIARNVTPAATAKVENSQSLDNATHLLRSLLKISENSPEVRKDKKPQNTTDDNWRMKNENHVQPAPPQRSVQQQNWRKENAAAYSSKSQQHQYSNEWTNSNFKTQVPVPPYPTFALPFHGPGPNQIPFPQFVNPHQRHGYHGTQDNQRSQNQFNRTHQNSQGFPKHLPTVSNANISLIPSWAAGQNSTPTGNQNKPNPSGNPSLNTSERLSNPFVPLQVQTSQRRIQNTGTSSTNRKEDIQAPKTILPRPQPVTQNATQQQSATSRPMKKKKPRIAANLPFLTE